MQSKREVYVHGSAALALGLALLFSGAQAAATTVNFDHDDAEVDVEFFSGITANSEIDLSAHGRLEVQPDVWLAVSTVDVSNQVVNGHVNASGLGAVGAPGANQLSGLEAMTLSFSNAESGGDAATVEISQITFENFGGTDGTDDAVTVNAGALGPITLQANTNQSDSGYAYVQTGAETVQGTGILSFNPPVELSTLVLTDASGEGGGSRLNQIVLRDPLPDPIAGAPNIIYIIVDDMGYSDIGCFGGEIDTPELDTLAAQGLRFRQHYTYAKCETSRTSLMSGMFHQKAGLGVRGDAKTLGEVLQAGGYRTYLTGKWHLDGNPVDRGFNGFYGLLEGASSHYDPFSQGKIYRDLTQLTSDDRPEDFYSSDYFAGEAINYIRQSVQNHPDRPFFVYLAFTAPHAPIQAPPDLVAKYRGRYTAGWDQIRAERVARQQELGILPDQWVASLRNEDIPPWDDLYAELQDAEDFRMAAYAAMVERVDYNVGVLLDALGPGDLNIADNTLIYFVSDNGSSPYPRTARPDIPPDDPDSGWRLGPAWAWVGNTPFRYYKQNQFNGGVTTPMIVHWPAGIPESAEGAVIDYPTHLMDVLPTVAELAGVDYAAEFPSAPSLDGISIASVFKGEGVPERPVMGFEYAKQDFAFIDYPWKISSYRREPWQLFNLETDRCETNNLAREYEAKVDELANAYTNWVDARNDQISDVELFTGMEPDTSSYTEREERYEDPLLNQDVFRIPPVWSQDAIGNVSVFDADEEDGTGIIASSLDGTQFASSTDDFGFLHQPFFGDGELVAKIVSFENCGSEALAGVMLRDGLEANAAFAMLAVQPNASGNPEIRLICRESGGGAAVTAASVVADSALPVWLRLVRDGNRVEASYSTDGRHYTTLPDQSLSLPIRLRGGIALHADLAAGTANGTIRATDFERSDRSAYATRDLDGNGYGELMDYALGLEFGDVPLRLPTLSIFKEAAAFRPEIAFSRRIGAVSGLDYFLMESADLVSPFEVIPENWSQIGVPQSLPDGLTERVRYRHVGEAGDKGFFRLQVGAQP